MAPCRALVSRPFQTAVSNSFARSDALWRLWSSRPRARLATIAPPHVVENYRAAQRRAGRLDRKPGEQRRGKQLLERLDKLLRGREDALAYQKLVRDLVEYLFVPPLGVPEFESRNEKGRDRRDIVMENPAREGLWSLWRQHYRAEYVVVDAKNHAGPLKKREIVDVAHYLKWYGPGLFAIVAHRGELGPGAKAAVREQWIASQRMIVAANDADFRQMVELREAASQPEAILAERIRSDSGCRGEAHAPSIDVHCASTRSSR